MRRVATLAASHRCGIRVDGAMNEAATVSWLATDPNFWTDLVRFAMPGAVLLLLVWVLAHASR
jgi:hypothetical protein